MMYVCALSKSDLSTGSHLDPPVALCLVGVVLGVVGSLNGDLGVKKYETILWFSFARIFLETSCPSARVSFPFLQLKATTSFFAMKVFFAPNAVAFAA